MKKSDLVERLQKEIDAFGDHDLLSYRIEDAGGSLSGYLYSPTRKMKNGRRAKMNFKEYRDFLLDERARKESLE
jgi:hypothetical protein